jgi:hypothetical protein
MNLKINHLAVWVCIVVVHALGFLWYGMVFRESWTALVELDPTKTQQTASETALWIANSVSIIAPIYLLAWLFVKVNVTSGVQGAIIGLLIIFCMYHLPQMTAYLFAARPYGLSWIHGGYYLVSFAIVGFVLGSWKKFEQ